MVAKRITASKLQEFDRILEVNGVRGSSVELAKALGSGASAAKFLLRCLFGLKMFVFVVEM